MNNLKKVGLTALAGSLAASTAYAGVLEVPEDPDLDWYLTLAEPVTSKTPA